MRTIKCADASEVKKLVTCLHAEMTSKRAIWGFIQKFDGLTVVVKGWAPVIDDVIRASGVRLA